MKTLGILGFGIFGRFLAKHLGDHFRITVSDLPGAEIAVEASGVTVGTTAEAASRDVVALCVHARDLEPLLENAAPHVRPGALVFDVASVKVKPAALMARMLPEGVEIIATHPMFGPFNAGNGLAGLPLVFCPIRTTRIERTKNFLSEILGLRLIVTTPEDHDRQMAYAQGLTQFIGNALREMPLPELSPAFGLPDHLHPILDTAAPAAYARFVSAQLENPFAEVVRQRFIESLVEIHSNLESLRK